MKYKKKSIVIEAEQWFSNGSHSQDNCETFIGSDGLPFQGEGKVVRYFRHPEIDGKTVCKQCNSIMHLHGWIDTFGCGHIVCPKDWIIRGMNGEFYPCKPDIFEKIYEKAE